MQARGDTRRWIPRGQEGVAVAHPTFRLMLEQGCRHMLWMSVHMIGITSPNCISLGVSAKPLCPAGLPESQTARENPPSVLHISRAPRNTSLPMDLPSWQWKCEQPIHELPTLTLMPRAQIKAPSAAPHTRWILDIICSRCLTRLG